MPTLNDPCAYTPLVVICTGDTVVCKVCEVFDTGIGHCRTLIYPVDEKTLRKIFKNDKYKLKYMKGLNK